MRVLTNGLCLIRRDGETYEATKRIGISPEVKRGVEPWVYSGCTVVWAGTRLRNDEAGQRVRS